MTGWATNASGKKRPTRKTGIFERWADADAFRKQELARTGKADARRTLAEQLTLWQDLIRATNRSANTIASYRYAIANHISPRIGSIALRSLDVAAVERWLHQMEDDGVGARTMQTAFNVLSRALKHAVRRGDLMANPCAVSERPSYRRKSIDPFSREELDWILADSFETPDAALIRMIASTGMRQGEAFGLRPQDVDADARTIRIVRQAVEADGKVHLQEYPKSNAGRRTLKMTDAVLALLVDHRRRLSARGLAKREFEFVAPEGGVIRRTTFGSRVWKPILARSAAERGVAIRHRGAHHLRHTFATMMLGEGVALHVVSKILGHARPSITADLYAHAVPEQIDEAVAAAGRLFG